MYYLKPKQRKSKKSGAFPNFAFFVVRSELLFSVFKASNALITGIITFTKRKLDKYAGCI